MERAIDLQVVFELALAFDAPPEGLAGILVAVPVTFEKTLTGLRQADRAVSRARDAHGLDQALLAEVTQIA